MEYKRYCNKSLWGMICALLAIALFNYCIDPGNIFSSTLVEKCGKWLLEGHDVAIMQNYEGRLLQKYLMENDSDNYDVMILGSSRTMDIGSPLFSDGSVRNYSVSGASVEDDIALYFLYEGTHKKPKKVILGMDAWLLNANSNQNRWKALAKSYEYGRDKLGLTETTKRNIGTREMDLEKYAQLLSWSYLKKAIVKVKNERGIGYCFADDRAKIPENAQIKCSDGSIIRSRKEIAEDAEPKAREYIAGKVYSLENYDRLDTGLQAEIKAFISYLKSKDIDIVLYLTPYHPIVYSYFEQNENYRNVMETEAYFRNVAEEFGLTILGSYNPERLGLSNADFLDGMHMRREAVERILKGKL